MQTIQRLYGATSKVASKVRENGATYRLTHAKLEGRKVFATYKLEGLTHA